MAKTYENQKKSKRGSNSKFDPQNISENEILWGFLGIRDSEKEFFQKNAWVFKLPYMYGPRFSYFFDHYDNKVIK
jgi:hypothetical protein